jgi:hypothetical protein
MYKIKKYLYPFIDLGEGGSNDTYFWLSVYENSNNSPRLLELYFSQTLYCLQKTTLSATILKILLYSGRKVNKIV